MTAILLCLLLLFPAAGFSAGRQIAFGRFGEVTVYRPQKIEHTAIFISGDGGWNLGVVDMAVELEKMNTLVIGVNITAYLKVLRAAKGDCSYPAADLEELSQFVQKDLGLAAYIRPVLVGYSSGATLVYAALAQAPPNTFKGALSMGFCPDLAINKPLCKGRGLEQDPLLKGKGFTFRPTSALEEPWIAFQGLADKVCDATAVENFVKNVKGGDIVHLPKVGHGFGVTRNWLPQFQAAFSRLSEEKLEPAIPEQVNDLPLVELPVKDSTKDYLAVIVSGDGGWASIDRELASVLVRDGVPVVGLNSLKYFWTKRSPESSAADLGRIMKYYLAAWGKKKAVLVGYSRGADVLPFMANRLPAELKDKVALLALLAPGQKTEFEMHMTDWLGGGGSGLPIKPEVENWKNSRILCFYGRSDKGDLCRTLAPERFTLVPLGGGHHFGGAYKEIAGRILEEAR